MSNEQDHGSFSVYVPQKRDSDLNKATRTYFRLGGANPYAPDGERIDDYDDAELMGVFIYTDGAYKQMANGSDVMSLVCYDGNLNSASYSFGLEGDTFFHDAEWSRTSKTGLSLGDSREFSLGYKCEFSLSAEQSIGASLGFEAKLGMSVSAKLDPLNVEFSKSAVKVEGLLGEFEVAAEKDNRGFKSASITSAPHDIARMGTLTAASIAYQAAIGAIGGLSGTFMLSGTIALPAMGDDEYTRDGGMKDAFHAMAIGGVTIGSLVTLLQVAGVVLGAVALVQQKAARALDQLAASQVAVTPLGAQVRSGATSYIRVTPLGIVISAPSVKIHGLQQMHVPAPAPPPRGFV